MRTVAVAWEVAVSRGGGAGLAVGAAWAVDPVWGAAVVAGAEDGATVGFAAFGDRLACGLADAEATALLAVRAAAIMADAAESTPPTLDAGVARAAQADRKRQVGRELGGLRMAAPGDQAVGGRPNREGCGHPRGRDDLAGPLAGRLAPGGCCMPPGVLVGGPAGPVALACVPAVVAAAR